MSNTLKHAERELEILSKSNSDPNNRPIIEEFKDEILALVDKFGRSGQSGGSAPYTAGAISQAVKKLCLQETIAPLTGEDDEWNDVTNLTNGEVMYQNNRESGVFKDGKNGKPYYIYAIVFDGDIGGRFTGSGSTKLNGETINSRQYIKSFPFTPKIFYVDVIDHRWKDKEENIPDVNGDWWTHSIKDEKQLEEVYQYYDKK